jgi:hypothetical protein
MPHKLRDSSPLETKKDIRAPGDGIDENDVENRAQCWFLQTEEQAGTGPEHEFQS